MGARANIKVNYENGSNIYFYAHWGGKELAVVLQSALNRGKDRWDDESYLARIIFSEMIKDNVLDNTGYGIAPYESDNEYPLINVNMGREPSVTINGKRWSFAEYCHLSAAEIVASMVT